MAQARPRTTTPAKRKAPAKKPPAAPAEGNGKADGKDAELVARTLLAIPNVEKGAKVGHDTLISAKALAEYDHADETRADRAAALWGDDTQLTGAILRKLRPLLREPINPRHVVTTGAAEGGKPMVTTGIRSVQVQVDRLDEVLGADHFRLLARHTPDGIRCRVHIVIGNDLQWCHLDADGELHPYTLLPDTAAVAGSGGTVYAGVQEADVLVHGDSWGGHKRGSAPADIWKGAFTNAAKLAIARHAGPGDHVYRLEFEDDPQAPEARAPRRGQQQAQAPAPVMEGAPITEAQAAKLINDLRAEDHPLRDKRVKADEGLKMFSTSAVKRWERLGVADTEEKLDDLIERINGALDAQAFDGLQS